MNLCTEKYWKECKSVISDASKESVICGEFMRCLDAQRKSLLKFWTKNGVRCLECDYVLDYCLEGCAQRNSKEEMQKFRNDFVIKE